MKRGVIYYLIGAVVVVVIATPALVGLRHNLYDGNNLNFDYKPKDNNLHSFELINRNTPDLIEVAGNEGDYSPSAPAKYVYGVASWYDYKLDGVWWSKSHRTCASRDFPRYSYVEVTNLDNGKSVVCYVNDWIEHPDRVIDLSSYAFSLIADKKLGLVNVKITEVK